MHQTQKYNPFLFQIELNWVIFQYFRLTKPEQILHTLNCSHMVKSILVLNHLKYLNLAGQNNEKEDKKMSSSESQHYVRKSNHKVKQICLYSIICEPDPKDKIQRSKDFEDKFQFFVVRPMAELGGGGTCDRWDAINATFTSKPIQTLFFCFSRLCLLVDQVWERRFWKLTYLQKTPLFV